VRFGFRDYSNMSFSLTAPSFQEAMMKFKFDKYPHAIEIKGVKGVVE